MKVREVALATAGTGQAIWDKRIVLLALALTGFTGMGYEVVLIKEFNVIFGATEIAASMVLASFMMGLALGAYTLGKISDRFSPLALLIGIEIVLAASALLLIPLVRLIEFIRFPWAYAAAFMLLLFPSFFIGGEIPAASKLMVRKSKEGEVIGSAYAADTAGAVFGALLTGLALIPALGSIRSTVVFGIMNAFVGVLLFLFARKKEGNR